MYAAQNVRQMYCSSHTIFSVKFEQKTMTCMVIKAKEKKMSASVAAP
jgi:hypothetical protein